MKIAVFLTLVFIFQAVAETKAQKITLHARNATLNEVMIKIQRQHGYTFFFLGDQIATTRVSVDVKHADLADAMRSILAKKNLDWYMEDRTIVVSHSVPQQTHNHALLPAHGNQQRTITGLVTDSKGSPLESVTVHIDGTNLTTITDEVGRYTIIIPEGDNTLTFSMVGYEKVTRNTTNQNTIHVTLNEVIGDLDEAVVVGYGTQKRINLTGAISTISGDVLKSRPINNVAQGLQGTIANFTITPSNGNPNSNPSFTVRGTTSINGGGPLVLVDGVEMNMNLVNPNDIESITVLKDAASSAIYGVRAAFGVVLITTKSANYSGKTIVSYDNNFALSMPTQFPDFVKRNYEHAEFINNSMKNGGLAPMYTDRDIAGMKAWDADRSQPMYEILNGEYHFFGYKDWKDLLLANSSPSQRHNLSISGGGEKTRFFASVGYTGQTGPLKVSTDKFSRLNTRLSVENNTFSWLKLGFKLLYTGKKYDEARIDGFGAWHNFVFTSPVRPFKWDGDPDYPQYDRFAGMYFDDQNTLAYLEGAGRNVFKSHDIWATTSADLTFTKEWTGHVDFNYNINLDASSLVKRNVPLITFKFAPVGTDPSSASISRETNTNSYYSLNAYTQYEKTIDKHYFKGMVGFNQELTQNLGFSANRLGLVSADLPSLSVGTGNQTVTDAGYEWALRGGFFRANYIYNDRYMIEVNGRYDGTSRFPQGHNYGFFPSVSAGWVVSKESFMQSSKNWLTSLKLRGSYGELGNQLLSTNAWPGNVRYYPYIPFLSSGATNNFLFGSVQDVTVNPAALVSDKLTWERTRTSNFGIDLSLFSKLSTSFDVFTRTTSAMLTSIELPEVIGVSAPPQNLGQLATKGWELSLNWNDKIGADFNYGIGVVVSDAIATITKFPNPTGTLSNYYVGRKMGEIWGYTTEGFFKDADDVAAHADQSRLGSNWAAGDIKYADLNDDKIISVGANTLDDTGDLTIIGNTTPRYTYGISPSVAYKGVSLSFFIQGVGKRDFYPNQQAFWPVSTQYFATQQWWVDDSWTPENPDAYFPRPIARNGKNQSTQTKYLQDASYLRLKNVTLGYHFNKNLLNKLKLSAAQVYINGENLFFISKIKGGYDPETAANNGAMVYPFPRAFSMGLNLTF